MSSLCTVTVKDAYSVYNKTGPDLVKFQPRFIFQDLGENKQMAALNFFFYVCGNITWTIIRVGQRKFD